MIEKICKQLKLKIFFIYTLFITDIYISSISCLRNAITVKKKVRYFPRSGSLKRAYNMVSVFDNNVMRINMNGISYEWYIM